MDAPVAPNPDAQSKLVTNYIKAKYEVIKKVSEV